MSTKSSATRAILSQQIQITLIRTFLLFAIVFAVKANAGFQHKNAVNNSNYNQTQEHSANP